LYNINNLTIEYVEIYRSLKKDFEESFATYKKSGTRFFSNLPTTVKSLTIEYDVFDNSIEALSSSDLKLAHFVYGDSL
jgi:hypothetical protein